MHNELYGIWYMENQQGQFIYVISGNQTEIHRAFWQIEKLCSRESPQKKKSEKFALASRFQGGYALGEIQHSPLSIEVGGWVCGIFSWNYDQFFHKLSRNWNSYILGRPQSFDEISKKFWT